MNRRRVIGISGVAALGMGLLAGSAAGEEKSLKEQLLGTWNLVSHESVLPDGSKFPPYELRLLSGDSESRLCFKNGTLMAV